MPCFSGCIVSSVEVLAPIKLTAQVKLQPTPEQSAALLRTIETANAACNRLSELAWEAKEFGQYPLHHRNNNEIYLVYLKSGGGYDDRRSRRDGEEMKPDVQGKVEELWPQVTTENLLNISHGL
jgi:hypothetical protein